MVNNFKLIRSLLAFESEGDFYFLQVLKRRKDNPSLSKDVKLINNYFIYSLEQFDGLEEHIINECNINNARAYIRLNVRNSKKIALQTLKKITDLIICEDYKAVKTAYISACGEFHSDKNKKWIIDVDNLSIDIDSLKNDLYKLQKETGKEPILIQIPTKNGIHIITHPFNLQEFKKQYSLIDIHKDNPTILYIPS